jgi:hypothetical protein
MCKISYRLGLKRGSESGEAERAAEEGMVLAEAGMCIENEVRPALTRAHIGI